MSFKSLRFFVPTVTSNFLPVILAEQAGLSYMVRHSEIKIKTEFLYQSSDDLKKKKMVGG